MTWMPGSMKVMKTWKHDTWLELAIELSLPRDFVGVAVLGERRATVIIEIVSKKIRVDSVNAFRNRSAIGIADMEIITRSLKIFEIFVSGTFPLEVIKMTENLLKIVELPENL
jgi:hypothetical protein